MKVYRNIQEFKGVARPVLTIGTFDGVHEGHRKIIDRLKEVAEEVGGESVMLTFFPHPRMVLFPDSGLELINTMEEKETLLERAGLGHFVAEPFTRTFGELPPEQYVKEVLVEGLGVKYLIIGYDHRFGKDRQGNLDLLRALAPKYGFEVEEIPAHMVEDVDVSSTKIRKALKAGDVRKANSFLGRAYSLTGEVVEGQKTGRSIGFPTANIHVPEVYKLIPADGVYAVRVILEGGRALPGMLNIGFRPTFPENEERTIEVNIFDWDHDLYGEQITVRFLERVRGEARFDGPEALREQLQRDKQHVQQVLERSDR